MGAGTGTPATGLRTDSYGSVAEVLAYVRHLLDGQTTFNTTTRPTGTEMDKFIDRASSTLNVALATAGFAVPVTNSTAKLACDDWVVSHAAGYAELTQRGEGSGEGENSRYRTLSGLSKSASGFVRANDLGFKRLGCTVSHKLSEGLVFTGETAESDRADPDDTSLAQPLFRRGLFDDSRTSASADDDD